MGQNTKTLSVEEWNALTEALIALLLKYEEIKETRPKETPQGESLAAACTK
ncbi:MAG: hypothetical protein U9Q76_02840 [candidate division WOR-3 bacterium]|nr:hypothetical protein [candidate division WOR-3 bacterium]